MNIAKEYKKDSLTGRMIRPGEFYTELPEQQKTQQQKEPSAEQQTDEQQQTEQEVQPQKKKTK